MKSTRPWRLRLVLVLVACALSVALPSTSLAASAPMCNELAQSIEAPPTIWPHRGGSISAVPACPDLELGIDKGAPQRIDNSFWLSPREAPLAMGTVVYGFRSGRLLLSWESGSDGRPGYRPGVYRPPRA